MGKIYDMTMTCVIGGKFYESIGNGKYLVMNSVCSDQYVEVKDKTLISKLNKIFKDKNEQRDSV